MKIMKLALMGASLALACAMVSVPAAQASPLTDFLAKLTAAPQLAEVTCVTVHGNWVNAATQNCALNRGNGIAADLVIDPCKDHHNPKPA